MNHNVKQYCQSYDYGCWLASTHMLNVFKCYGQSYSQYLSLFISSVYLDDYAKMGDPPHWVKYDASWLGPNNGLRMDNYILTAFAAANDLNYVSIANPSKPVELGLNIDKGPLMVAGDIVGVGIHFIVLKGYDSKTEIIDYLDPMPVRKGSFGRTTTAQFLNKHPGAFKHLFWKK